MPKGFYDFTTFKSSWLQLQDWNWACKECGAVYDQPITHACNIRPIGAPPPQAKPVTSSPRPGYYYSFCYIAMMLLTHIAWAVARPTSGKREDDMVTTRADRWLKEHAQ